MNIYLKVKIASLAAEARIIRKLAAKRRQKNDPVRLSLHDHRKGIVRSTARASQLAYAFLRGKDYLKVEGTALSQPDWSAVGGMVERFGVGTAAERAERTAVFQQWKKTAQMQVIANLIAYHGKQPERAAKRVASRLRQDERKANRQIAAQPVTGAVQLANVQG